jgi:hypothetical protein
VPIRGYATANWHSSYIDAITYSLQRVRHRTFFDIWPNRVGNMMSLQTPIFAPCPVIESARTTAHAARRSRHQSRHRFSRYFGAFRSFAASNSWVAHRQHHHDVLSRF